MEQDDLVGGSDVIKQLMAECGAIARSRSKVLITGESGVGKEVFARYIHRRSARHAAPMVTLNCASVPETLLESELFGHVRGSFTDAHRDRLGLFEAADRGTVLLDEIGEMGMRMQTMLLRFLESGEIQRVGSDQPSRLVDVRLIAATNRDLLEGTRNSTFRLDLYYRLNVVHLCIPPLRERPEDVRPLMAHFLATASALDQRPAPLLTEAAAAFLERYHWPGNVRELKNIAERLVVSFPGESVRVDDLPAEILAVERAIENGATPALLDVLVQECFGRMANGHESFWTAVFDPFMRRDMTREAVRAIVRRGLERTHGSYPLLATLFNLPDEDYRKLMRFLHKYDCHIPTHTFRQVSSALPLKSPAPLKAPAAIRPYQQVG